MRRVTSTLIFVAIAFLLNESATAAAEVDFSSALQQMAARSTEVQSQRATLDQARARHLADYGTFLPSVSLQLSDRQNRQPSYFLHQQPGQLVGTMNLFHSFADVAAFNAGSSIIEKEAASLRAVELANEQKNIELALNYLASRMVLEVAKTNLQLSTELVEVEDKRYKKGSVPLQELQKAMVQKNNDTAKIRSAEADYASALSALTSETGGDTIKMEWPWKQILQVTNAEKALAKKWQIESSPSYVSAVHFLEAQDLGMRSKFREFFPSLDLTVGYGYEDYRVEKDPGWQTMLTLTIPLLDLRQHSTYRVQVEQKTLAQAELERTKRNLDSEWSSLKERVIISIRSAQELEANREIAQSLYHDNQRRLRVGRSTINDILIDQSRLADAEVLAIGRWAEAHKLYAQMCHLRGERVSSKTFGCQP